MTEKIYNVEQMAKAMYGLDGEPTKAQRNTVAKLCRSGQLDAVKAGRRWLIRVDWPDGVTPTLSD